MKTALAIFVVTALFAMALTTIYTITLTGAIL